MKNKNINLSEKCYKIVKKNPNIKMSWDDFFDKFNIPKRARNDFAVAAILKGFREIYNKNKDTFLEKMKITLHKEKEHGWTKQKSKCNYAVWWDCSFLCSNKKINPKKELIACKLDYPDFKKCSKDIEKKKERYSRKINIDKLITILTRLKQTGKDVVKIEVNPKSILDKGIVEVVTTSQRGKTLYGDVFKIINLKNIGGYHHPI